ncbi:MAG TPA: hypothetical protein VGN72_03755 [Tepidisphaeraceae bacterium]|jgi:hypothetical protein|nr:hypothetical protein [Tepidisphaeraceae bacterium]
MKTFLTAFTTASLATAVAAQAGLLFSAGVPVADVDISGGPVTITVPLYIEQTSPTTSISGVGLYSVGSAVTRTGGSATLTGAARFDANFDDAGFSSVSFTPTSALLKVQRDEVGGLSNASGKLQFGTLSLLLSNVGTSTFTLSDNDLDADDTLDGNIDPLDVLISNSAFSVTAVVPEPAVLSFTLLAVPALLRRRRGQ